MPGDAAHHADHSIWWFAFGYFAAYAPYSALTKVLSSGLWGDVPKLTGTEMLPVTVIASCVGMFVFLTSMGWWKYAGRRRVLGFDVPFPTVWTLFSGLCTAAIVVTTTLAYTFEGVSIVFIMLLMRGGLLVLAPLVDFVARRKVQWFSWAGLALSFVALVVSVGGNTTYHVTFACGLDIAVYLASYFVRLRFMSHIAKNSVGDSNRRYFVEEQLVATPAAVIILVLLATFGQGPAMEQIHHGLTGLWSHPALPWLIVIGLLSQGTGIFGGLILLDKRENTYCVPVNRASSVLAGVVATYALAALLAQHVPTTTELIGAGLVLAAIVVLSLPPILKRRGAKGAAVAPT